MNDNISRALRHLLTCRHTGPEFIDDDNDRVLYSYVYFQGNNGVYFISSDDSVLHYYKELVLPEGTIPVEQEVRLVEILRNAPIIYDTPTKAERLHHEGYDRSMYNIYFRDAEGNKFAWAPPAHQLVIYTLQKGAIETKLADKQGANCLEVNHMRSMMTNEIRSVFRKACDGYCRLCIELRDGPEEFKEAYKTVESLVEYLMQKDLVLSDGKPWAMNDVETRFMLHCTRNMAHVPVYPRDNRIQNLELCTRTQNIDHLRLVKTFNCLGGIAFSAKKASRIINSIRQNAELKELLAQAESKEPLVLRSILVEGK